MSETRRAYAAAASALRQAALVWAGMAVVLVVGGFLVVREGSPVLGWLACATACWITRAVVAGHLTAADGYARAAEQDRKDAGE